jgi:hypothetical protein
VPHQNRRSGRSPAFAQGIGRAAPIIQAATLASRVRTGASSGSGLGLPEGLQRDLLLTVSGFVVTAGVWDWPLLAVGCG